MTRQLYVGNLSFDTTEDTLRTTFAQDGRAVSGVTVVVDPKSRRSRGFGFVEMESEEEAAAAMEALDGTELDGRPIKVNEGKERPEFRVRAPRDTFRRGGGGKRRGKR